MPDRVRHDSPRSSSKEAVDFKSTAVKPLDLWSRVVELDVTSIFKIKKYLESIK